MYIYLFPPYEAYIAGFQEQVSQENKTETCNIFKMDLRNYVASFLACSTVEAVTKICPGSRAGGHGGHHSTRRLSRSHDQKVWGGRHHCDHLWKILSAPGGSGDTPSRWLTTLSHRLLGLTESHVWPERVSGGQARL